MKRILYLTAFLFLFSFYSVDAQINKVDLFSLTEVKLLESPFYQAQQRDLEYILALDPDRLLAPFLREAGLVAKASTYTNWENTGLDGHIGGHYLSALAKMYAATGNQEVMVRLNYMLQELKRCQDTVGTGFIGGTPGSLPMWKEIKEGNVRAGGFSLNDKWVPLYNIHKTYAGLRDAYLLTNNELPLDLLVKFTDWMIDVTKNLSDEQMEDMLRSEHGGLNETFADVAAITKDDKYLELAHRFCHRAVLNPLLKKEDELTGMHANTQIPKVIGYKRIADLEGNKEWDNASWFFWETVVGNRTISIGGNSVREHFHPADDFSSMVDDREGPETCNSYNMLRLSELLYKSSLDKRMVDYYERTLYNHILSTIEPNNGGFVYFTPMRPGHYRVYSQPETSFWCCVGSGLENHAQYGQFIYAYNKNDLYVNLFIPSELNWKDKGVSITQNTQFPKKEKVSITINKVSKEQFSIHLRQPEWVKNKAMRVFINGDEVSSLRNTIGYFSLHRKWKKGDVIEFILPMEVTVDQLPDRSDYYSFRYGPIVLAARMNSENLDGLYADDSRMGHIAQGNLMSVDDTPTLIGDPDDFIANLKRTDTRSLAFVYEGKTIPEFTYLELIPFYNLHNSRYVVYFRQIDSMEKLEKIRAQEAIRMELEKKTVDVVYVGEQQPESDHSIKYEDSEVSTFNNERCRNAKGWFSYEMKVKGEASKLLVKVRKEEKELTSIFIDGKEINVAPKVKTDSEAFILLEYELKNPLTQGIYRLKFTPKKEGTYSASIFEARLIK